MWQINKGINCERVLLFEHSGGFPQRRNLSGEWVATDTCKGLADPSRSPAVRHENQSRSADAAMGQERGQERLPFVACRKCGAFASAGGQPKALLHSCGTPTRAGKLALARMDKGLHPKAGRAPPLCHLAAWRGAQQQDAVQVATVQLPFLF